MDIFSNKMIKLGKCYRCWFSNILSVLVVSSFHEMRLVTEHYDEVAEWLRRWTANPLGSPRVSSNLILVGKYIFIGTI